MRMKTKIKALISMIAIFMFAFNMAIPAVSTYASYPNDHVLSISFRDNSLGHGSVQYSENGGTHHSALVYGVSTDALAALAKRFGWKFVNI